MIENFDDFCLWIYVLVDDFWKMIEKQFKHPRQKPQCSDSELLSMILISEARGWDVETEALSHWQEHRDLFPFIPSQSRFNRRRRQLRCLQAYSTASLSPIGCCPRPLLCHR
jgi:hypothetical protein